MLHTSNYGENTKIRDGKEDDLYDEDDDVDVEVSIELFIVVEEEGTNDLLHGDS
jgi:hypothetical protein